MEGAALAGRAFRQGVESVASAEGAARVVGGGVDEVGHGHRGRPVLEHLDGEVGGGAHAGVLEDVGGPLAQHQAQHAALAQRADGVDVLGQVRVQGDRPPRQHRLAGGEHVPQGLDGIRVADTDVAHEGTHVPHRVACQLGELLDLLRRLGIRGAPRGRLTRDDDADQVLGDGVVEGEVEVAAHEGGRRLGGDLGDLDLLAQGTCALLAPLHAQPDRHGDGEPQEQAHGVGLPVGGREELGGLHEGEGEDCLQVPLPRDPLRDHREDTDEGEGDPRVAGGQEDDTRHQGVEGAAGGGEPSGQRQGQTDRDQWLDVQDTGVGRRGVPGEHVEEQEQHREGAEDDAAGLCALGLLEEEITHA